MKISITREWEILLTHIPLCVCFRFCCWHAIFHSVLLQLLPIQQSVPQHAKRLSKYKVKKEMGMPVRIIYKGILPSIAQCSLFCHIIWHGTHELHRKWGTKHGDMMYVPEPFKNYEMVKMKTKWQRLTR